MQMTPAKLASLIVDYVRGQDFATFAGLAKRWPEHFDMKGEALALKSTHAPNVIIWYGISDLGGEALGIARQRVELIACSPSSYLAAGAGLKLPLAEATSLKAMLGLHHVPLVARMLAAQ
jgi:hypothetical protein